MQPGYAARAAKTKQKKARNKKNKKQAKADAAAGEVEMKDVKVQEDGCDDAAPVESAKQKQRVRIELKKSLALKVQSLKKTR